ncbi:MAG: S8 family serine peptidase [Parcubacteria group bacterium]|nr:S8 family serine peptidase [Parcubacteria group bacterium]
MHVPTGKEQGPFLVLVTAFVVVVVIFISLIAGADKKLLTFIGTASVAPRGANTTLDSFSQQKKDGSQISKPTVTVIRGQRELWLQSLSNEESIFLGSVGNNQNSVSYYVSPREPPPGYRETALAGSIIIESPEKGTLAKKNAELNQEIESVKKQLSRTTDTRSRATIEARLTTLITNKRSTLVREKSVLEQKQTATLAALQRIAPTVSITQKFITSFNGFTATATPKDTQALKQQGYRVWRNAEVHASLTESVPLINADDVWATKDASGVNVTGRGIRIAIIDTGIDYRHPDLGGCLGASCKVAGGFDVINNDADPMDDMGHGTHVAAIAAGKGALKGVAPDALFYAYKVLDRYGSGSFSLVISGIERALDPNLDGDLSDGAHVINLSLGGIGNPDDPLSQAVDNAVLGGAVVVVAAGNRGYPKSISSPGTARDAITVGASTKADLLAWFSSRGPVVWNNHTLVKPDLVAPGAEICAAQWENWLSERQCVDDGHIRLDGTSMASPHIAGAAALTKQAHPEWSPAQIKAAVRGTAVQLGYTLFDRGAGRLDAYSPVSIVGSPPVAKLSPLNTNGITRPVMGTVASENLMQWQLSYTLLGSGTNGNWTELIRSSTLPTSASLFSWNTNFILDGEYLLRLSVTQQDRLQATDYGYLVIDKLRISHPRESDVFRSGSTVNVEVALEALGAPAILLEYGVGRSPSQWREISRSQNVRQTWDTSGLATGWYTLRASLTGSTASADQETRMIYLDATLKPGWPQRLDFDRYDCGQSEPCPAAHGLFETVVSDLDGDGASEIIVVAGKVAPYVTAYRADGERIWTAHTRIYDSPASFSLPLVEDLDNDGNKEVIVYVGRGLNDPGRLYAFTARGALKSGWPLDLPYDIPTMVAADINRDGKRELILKGNTGLPEAMTIVSAEGKVMSRWNLSDIAWLTFGPLGTPAVGNFDDDADLEIVIARPAPHATANTNDGELHVFNSDGSEVNGWPRVMQEGYALGSSPVVADLDRDGRDDIVVALQYASDTFPDVRYGGVYAFDRRGALLPGWPVGKGRYYASSPSIGDLDGDGDLEIAVSNYQATTEVYHHDGSMVQGWPQRTRSFDLYATIMGDANGDGKPDVLTATSTYILEGGLYAWNAQGSLLPGFPKHTEIDAVAYYQPPPTLTDVDGDGRIDLVGSTPFEYDFAREQYKWRSSIYVWDLDARTNPATMHWPTFHHDAQRTGRYAPLGPAPDTTPPTVSITSPTQGATISGVVILSASAADNVAVERVEFYYHSQFIGVDYTSPYTTEWDTTKVSNTSYNLIAKAYDQAGNIGISPVRTVTVNNILTPTPLPTKTKTPTDTTPPTVSITQPKTGSTVSKGASVTITATATDNVAVTKVEFYIGTSSLSLLCTDTTAPYSCLWKAPTISVREPYQIEARAYDAKGNRGVSSRVFVGVK